MDGMIRTYLIINGSISRQDNLVLNESDSDLKL